MVTCFRLAIKISSLATIATAPAWRRPPFPGRPAWPLPSVLHALPGAGGLPHKKPNWLLEERRILVKMSLSKLQ